MRARESESESVKNKSVRGIFLLLRERARESKTNFSTEKIPRTDFFWTEKKQD